MAQNAPVADAAVPTGPRREVLIILPGLLLAIMLAMLDQLVVSTALPRIVGDLGGVAHLSWVVTAYVLAATVTTPLYGKLGDQYGRKRLLMFAIILFLIGSALAGLSQTMDQLIAFRALQGLGAGGLLVGAIATIGDLVSPRERGQYMGYIMAAMTLAMIAGRLVGGYITDTLSWRWIFYINMPIGGAALIYLALTLHVPVHKVKHKIDYLGAALLTMAASSLVLLTTWGGTQYPWRSVQIMGLGAVAIASTAGFIAVERRAAEPVLPLHVFRNRNFSLVTAMSFLLGLAMFGALTFLPLYQQTVQHLSATESGLMLIPLMLGSTVTTLIAGRVTTRTGRYKALPIIGGAVMTVAMYLLTMLNVNTSLVTSACSSSCSAWGWASSCRSPRSSRRTAWPRATSVWPAARGRSSSRSAGRSACPRFGAIFAHRLTSEMHARAAVRFTSTPAAGSSTRSWSRTCPRRCSTSCSPRSRTRPPPCSSSPRQPRRRCSSWPVSSRRCRCAAGEHARAGRAGDPRALVGCQTEFAPATTTAAAAPGH